MARRAEVEQARPHRRCGRARGDVHAHQETAGFLSKGIIAKQFSAGTNRLGVIAIRRQDLGQSQQMRQIPVAEALAHVEAGLRTGDLRQPFPEETNRVLTTRPDYSQKYSGLELTATKRMSHKWMFRGNLTMKGYLKNPAAPEAAGDRRPAMADRQGRGQAEPGTARALASDPRPHQGDSG